MASDRDAPETNSTPTYSPLDLEPNSENNPETDLPVALDIDTEELPEPRDPPEPRTYIEIRPTTDSLQHRNVSRAMNRLYAALDRATKTGLRHRLTGSTQTPLVEWLVVSDGRADPTVRYLVGTTHEELRETLVEVLRTALPRTYELNEVSYHPRFVEDHLPVQAETTADDEPTGGDPSPSETSTTPSETLTQRNDADRQAPPVDPDYLTHPYVAGVEYEATATYRQDWLTPLSAPISSTSRTNGRRDRPNTRRGTQSRDDGATQTTLTGVLEAMSDAEVPVVYQAVCRFNGSARDAAEEYIYDLEHGNGNIADMLLRELVPELGDDPSEYVPPPADQARIDDIKERNCHQTMTVSARAVALTRHTPDQADRVARRLASALSPASGPDHEVTGRVHTDEANGWLQTDDAGTQVYEDLCERMIHDPAYEATSSRLPWRSNSSRGIVLTPEELPAVCLLDGAGLTVQGERALATRPAEQTALALPSPSILLQYRPPGMALGMPLTNDRQPSGDPIYLPPDVQPTHQFIIGGTGSGKTVAMQTAALTNHGATDGPDLHFYHKAGAAEDYLRAHYATHGTLENVQYFDLTQVLPALSFFDIRPLLEAGIPREEARSRKAGHYAEILEGLMGSERYNQAQESTKLISNMVRALFDPIHGADSYSHKDLHERLERIQTHEEPPATTTEGLTRSFNGLVERDRDVFTRIVGGALGRIETIATDGRLAPLFNHTTGQSPTTDRTRNDDGASNPSTAPTGAPAGDGAAHESHSPSAGPSPSEGTQGAQTDEGADPSRDGEPTQGQESAPRFSFTDIVDDDQVVIFDFGGMDERVKRALTLVLFSDLWSALKAREEDERIEESPLVNCYVDEAGGVADSSLVDTFLSEGRSFGLAMCLGVQYPKQLDSPDPEDDTYLEALNEIATVVAGQVRVDDDLASVFTTAERSQADIEARLASMPSGEWLVRPGAGFGQPIPRPFLAKSLPALPGHPAGEQPLDGATKSAYRAARTLMVDTTRNQHGLSVSSLTHVDSGRTDKTQPGDAHSDPEPDGEHRADEPHEPTQTEPAGRTDSLLPYTARLPDCLDYDAERHAIECTTCTTRYDPDIDGVQAAIECCHSLEEVDRDDIPVCSPSLKRSAAEIAESEWSVEELLFVQAVWDAQQRRTHDLEYDLQRDSMIRLREYAGLDASAMVDLIDADILRKDTTHPHLLYSVSAEGRAVIGEHNREGIDHGAGKGDLGESSHHVMLVAFAEDIAHTYRQDPDSAVDTVESYYERDDGHRLDVVGLDSEGDIVLTIEAERVNHDVAEAAVTDFDKMAACDPDDALWVVTSQSDAVDIMEALHDPSDGDPRIDRTYSHTTPTSDYKIDAPGMTDVFTVSDAQSLLEEVSK
ncbi:ATP-binding protein [Halosimplex halophilum]|uniref:ATP-binding protein n=1 Tax=Halosimplex halophilum TaxID=2559572 RepID=UPI00107FB09F|nr:ATP-binding protein [Halosimplex halophilum]